MKPTIHRNNERGCFLQHTVIDTDVACEHTVTIFPEGDMRLELNGCPVIDDVAPVVANMPELTALDLSYCQKLKSVSALGILSRLQVLSLRGCLALNDVAGLEWAPALQKIDLAWCTSVLYMAPLMHAGVVVSLDLSFCRQIHAVPWLAHMPHLEVLNLVGCTALTDAADVAAAPNLRSVNMRGCTLKTTSCFGAAKKLESINLAECEQLTDTCGMWIAPHLRTVSLAACIGITTLAGIDNTRSLEQLDISWCPLLIDVAPLLKVDTLHSLIANHHVFHTSAVSDAFLRKGVHLKREN